MLINNPKELAMMVKNQRKSAKLSQWHVGDLVGLKQGTISSFENKPEATKLDTLFRILSAADLELHISPKTPAKTPSDWPEEW